MILLIAALAFLILRRTDAPVAWRWTMALGAYLVCAPWFLPWHAIPLIGLGLVAGEGVNGRGLRGGALTLTATSLMAIPLIRFGVPGAAFLLGSAKRDGDTSDVRLERASSRSG